MEEAAQVRRSTVPSIPASVSVRLPAPRQGRGHSAAERSASTHLECCAPVECRDQWSGAWDLDRSELLGLEFERSRATAIVDRCLHWCRAPRATHIILTANASHLCLMRRDASLRDACPRCRSGGRRRHVGRVGARRAGPTGTGTSSGDRPDDGPAVRRQYRGPACVFSGSHDRRCRGVVAHCRHRFPGLVVVGNTTGIFTAAITTRSWKAYAPARHICCSSGCPAR